MATIRPFVIFGCSLVGALNNRAFNAGIGNSGTGNQGILTARTGRQGVLDFGGGSLLGLAPGGHLLGIGV
jgi:hypothetical protein